MISYGWVLSPAAMIESRVLLAALFLLLVAQLLKKQLPLRQHWKHFLILGLFNSALPFLLLAWSAKTLTASMLSVLNATSPIWGLLIGLLFRQSTMTVRSALGLAIGITGVTVLVGMDNVLTLKAAPLAILTALGAAMSYGIASNYAHSAKTTVSSFDNAHGSMWAASLLILPIVPFSPANTGVTTQIVSAVILLGILCTGVAYLLYFRLIDALGAPSTLTVTFLVPVFGTLWGHYLLGESIGWHTIAGGISVLIGTALVTGFSIKTLFGQSRTTKN
ncbi:DMT family transporter [uncultured Endozoicomonas sp.]|uniref:DMT family transporter n=1 Tax=uncultured Endozoicomonas sp. TaxID=432652 RepID=UPI002627A843|nr:DMT family transporter [uncultured Endozoicomonas sp.]